MVSKKFISFYLSIVAFVLSLFFIGVTDCYAQDTGGNYLVSFVYEGDDRTGTPYTLDHGTTFTWSFTGWNSAWHPVFDLDSRQLKVWNNHGYAINLVTRDGANLYNVLYQTYANNPQEVTYYIGGADQYVANLTTSQGRFIFNTNDESFSYRLPPTLEVYGAPKVRLNSMTIDDVNALVDSFTYQTPNIQNVYDPQLLKQSTNDNIQLFSQLMFNITGFDVLDSGVYNYFGFNVTNGRTDILIRNAVLNFKDQDGKVTTVIDSQGHSWTGQTVGYAEPLPSWLKIYLISQQNNTHYPETSDLSIGFPVIEFAPYVASPQVIRANALESIKFEIAYSYPNSIISNWITVDYNASTGQVTTTGGPLPPATVDGTLGNGYITSPVTQVTGTYLFNQLAQWMNQIGLMLNSVTGTLVSITASGKQVASSIGQIYALIFNNTVGQLIQMSIFSVIILRIFRR